MRHRIHASNGGCEVQSQSRLCQVTADLPESSQITADRPESCHFRSVAPRSFWSVLQYPRLASSMEDPQLQSAGAAGIPKLTHSSPPVPELIPLSVALPIMGIALWCVWAAYTTTEPPEVAASILISPKVVADAVEPPEVVAHAAVSPEAMAPATVSPKVGGGVCCGTSRGDGAASVLAWWWCQQCTFSLSCRGRRESY